jgi:hypothetical protein
MSTDTTTPPQPEQPGARILELPRPDGRCSLHGCTRPARMAIVAGHGLERVYWDWRALPSTAGARLLCKQDGAGMLASFVEIYVSDDDEPMLDPGQPAADPNATMLANLTREC